MMHRSTRLALREHGTPQDSGRVDSPIRKFQHLYAYPLLSIIYYLWRYFSVVSAFRRKDLVEGTLLLANYAWLALALPHSVAIGSIFFGGLLVGGLVSATHQSEEIMLSGASGPPSERERKPVAVLGCVRGRVHSLAYNAS
jgi:hypothetical protein